MRPIYHKLLCLGACAALVVAGGCQAPWSGGTEAVGGGMFGRASSARVTKAPEHPAATATPSATAAATPPTGTATTDEATLTAVMDEVRKIGSDDPAAQQLLIDELQHSKPTMWPLVIEQFRSSMAYHQQLAASKTAAGVSAAPNEPPALKAGGELGSASPSMKVGELVDPRGIRGDAGLEQTFATANPANMPAPMDRNAAIAIAKGDAPRPFTVDGAAQPLVANANAMAVGAAAGATSAQVVPAAFDAAVADKSDVSQAVFNAPAELPESTLATPLKPGADHDSRNWQDHVKLAIDDLQASAAQSPSSTAEVHQLVSLRLLQLLSGHTEEALKPIPNISAEEQDFWSGQIFALATYLDHHTEPDDKRRAAASVTHLDDAVGHLRELGSLSVRNLAFCKHVYDYGAYEPYDDPKFASGEQLSLYVEVENYHSASTEEGYRTSLGTSYEIVDDAGKRVCGGEFPDVDDCCKSRRRDFHIQYGLALPKSLVAGKYRLQLVMKDRQSDKIGNGMIAFEVRGK
jgi:hypothetical protein